MTRRRRGSYAGPARGFASAFACLLCVAFVFVSLFGPGSAAAVGRQQQKAAEGTKDEGKARTLYRISLRLDFDARTYEGTERVRWTNRDDRPASFLYFHLYPNARADDERAG